MPKANTKPAPPHVAVAQSAVQQLAGHADIEALRKLLPSLAARLHQSGQLVTADALNQHTAKGIAHLKEMIFNLTPLKSQRTYEGMMLNYVSGDERDTFADYIRWGDLDSANVYPALLKSQKFQECYETVRHILAIEGHAHVTVLAADTARLFASKERLFAYIDKWVPAGTHSFHDAICMLKLPAHTKGIDMEGWREAVVQHGPKMATLVEHAYKLPRPVRSFCGHNWNYHDTRYKISRLRHVDRRPESTPATVRNSQAVSFFSEAPSLKGQFNAPCVNGDSSSGLSVVDAANTAPSRSMS